MKNNNLDYIKQYRTPEYDINPEILSRWSPRAMSGEAVSKDELMGLIEAAKWAPSAFNEQPWFFLYSFKESKTWPLFFDLLAETNKLWVKEAGALIVLLSRRNFVYNDKNNLTHSFDSGAAWENLALQANYSGLIAHAMSGFDYERARKDLNVPDSYSVEAMIAIGRPGGKENLAANFQEKEFPSNRKTIKEITQEGIFE